MFSSIYPKATDTQLLTWIYVSDHGRPTKVTGAGSLPVDLEVAVEGK